MEVTKSRVRDFTTGVDSLEVDVVHGEVYETLAALYAIPDCFESGAEYQDSALIERLKDRLDDELAGSVIELDDSWSVYLGLLGLAYDLGKGHSMDGFVAHLRAMDPLDFRRMILAGGHPASTEPEKLEAAVNGDSDAIDQVLGDHHSALRKFLLAAPTESARLLIDVIERFHDQAMRPELGALLPTLERDAHDKRAFAKTLPAETFVEKATRGVTFEPSAGVRGIVVIPSIVLRPWTLMVQHHALRIFVYSVDEDALNADPAAPPAFLIELYKALGDERRLRLLAELWRGDTDLKTLSQRVDLAKSTTHHHLRALRTAGLVRVVVRDDDKVYSLRKDALADAGPLLEDFLTRIPSKE